MSAVQDANEARRLYQLLQPFFLSYAPLLDLGRGSAFPTTGHDGAAVQSGARFWRDDLDFACFYDGTRWMTVEEYTCVIGVSDSIVGSYAATTANVRLGLLRNDYECRLTRGQISYFVGATNNAPNNITYAFKDNTAATVWTFNTGGGTPDTPSTNVTRTISEGSFTQPGAIRNWISLDMTVFGAPSAQFPRVPVIWYRLIVT